jgi:hypothetical protein
MHDFSSLIKKIVDFWYNASDAFDKQSDEDAWWTNVARVISTQANPIFGTGSLPLSAKDFHTIGDTTEELVCERKRGKAKYRHKVDADTIVDMLRSDKTGNLTESSVLPVTNVDQIGKDCAGYIVYNRLCKHRTSFLWPLDYHVDQASKGLEDTIPFENKVTKIIFRGALSTDVQSSVVDGRVVKASRFDVALFWKGKDPRIDIFLTNIPESSKRGPKYEKNKTKIIGCVQSPQSPAKQQVNKYVLCLEGADISTSLGWVLASNCVPIVPFPQLHEVWYFDILEPFVNFVPCSPDCKDLADVLDWCESNQDACKDIAARGRSDARIVFEPDFVKSCKEKFIEKWKLDAKHFGVID